MIPERIIFVSRGITVPATRLDPWPTALLKRAWVSEAATTIFVSATHRNIWTEPEYTFAMCRATHDALINLLKPTGYVKYQ